MHTFTKNHISVCINDKLTYLREHGSIAVPGYMRPEGVVIYQPHSKYTYKVTLENDEAPKGSWGSNA